MKLIRYQNSLIPFLLPILKSNRTRQKNNRGDSKVESNDSPEILGLPSGVRSSVHRHAELFNRQYREQEMAKCLLDHQFVDMLNHQMDNMKNKHV